MTKLLGPFLGLVLTLIPTPAAAWCGRDDCGGTQVSAMTVYHTSGEINVVPVEPDTEGTIAVTVYWDELEL